ncbi:hypothetical protein FF1_031701 [Malus domestica]
MDREMGRNVGVRLKGTRVQRNGVREKGLTFEFELLLDRQMLKYCVFYFSVFLFLCFPAWSGLTDYLKLEYSRRACLRTDLGQQAASVCFEIFNGVLALESARDGPAAAQSAQSLG